MFGNRNNASVKRVVGGSGATTIVSDTFTRANSGTLGTATTGQTWTDSGALAFGISSNKAVVASGVNFGVTTLNSGTNNGTITVDATWTTNAAVMIVFRSDGTGSNRWIFELSLDGTSVDLTKTIADADTTIQTQPFVHTNGTTYSLKVVLNGSSINCYVNNVLKITATDAQWQANTKHGLGIYSPSAITASFDNFLVTT